jgi:hypothetical protein
MTLHRWATVLLPLGLACSGVALAAERVEQRSVNASTERETRIAYYGLPDEMCKAAGDPQVAIIETPSYGTIGFKNLRLRATPSSVPERNGPCVGKFIDVTAVYYKSTPGFHGSDRVRIRVRFKRPPPATETITLEEQIYVGVR